MNVKMNMTSKDSIHLKIVEECSSLTRCSFCVLCNSVIKFTKNTRRQSRGGAERGVDSTGTFVPLPASRCSSPLSTSGEGIGERRECISAILCQPFYFLHVKVCLLHSDKVLLLCRRKSFAFHF